MRYTLKAGMLYKEDRQAPLIRMKGVFSGPEKNIYLPNEEQVLRTDIRNLPVPSGKRKDVRFREYVMLDPNGRTIASGKRLIGIDIPASAQAPMHDLNHCATCRIF